MNRVFVLKEIERVEDGISIYDSGYGGASRNTYVNEKQNIRRFIKSFLRKEGNIYNGTSVEDILNGFINYLENIEYFEGIENIDIVEEIDDPIDNRFDIMDL